METTITSADGQSVMVETDVSGVWVKADGYINYITIAALVQAARDGVKV